MILNLDSRVRCEVGPAHGIARFVNAKIAKCGNQERKASQPSQD